MKSRSEYASFLLRIWRAGNHASAAWHASLEDTRTGARHVFADLPGLIAFLEALSVAPPQPRPADESEAAT